MTKIEKSFYGFLEIIAGSSIKTAGLIVLSTLVIAGSYYYYNENEFKKDEVIKYNELSALSKLKADQISDWRKERVSDIEVYSSGVIKEQAAKYLKTKNIEAFKKDIRKRFLVYNINNDYQDLIISDLKGNILLSVCDNHIKLNENSINLVKNAAEVHSPVFGELYISNDKKNIYIEIAATINDPADTPVFCLLFRINPENNLYNLVNSWPLPSKSAETLLVKKEGDSVLFLSKMRFSGQPALSMSLPLVRTEIPAVQAVLGREGKFIGKDYRGKNVIADIRHIPKSQWYMIAKIDKDEILSETIYRGKIVTILAGILILAAAFFSITLFLMIKRKLYQRIIDVQQQNIEMQEEIRTAFYSIGDAVIATNKTGLIKRMNRVAEELTGWTEKEAKGRIIGDVFNIVNGNTRQEAQNPVLTVIKENKAAALANNTILISKNGKEYIITDTAAPMQGAGGEIIGTVLVFRDESENIKIMEQMQKTQKLESLGILAGGIAHDFNNILVSVLGYADLSLLELPEKSPVKENINEIVKASRQAAELCRQMLAYAGKGQFFIEDIGLNELVNSTLHLIKTSISKMIQINISLNDTSPVVIGDKTQIRQVIMNLVINASESIVEKNGIISISTGLSKLTAKELDKMLFHDKTIEGEYGWIAVRDNGCGMKKETLNKIFEPFFTTKFTGRGLGMSAVLGFVRSHNGAIEVESELGKGSAFKVYLPVSSMEDQAVNNKIDTCIDPKTKKINSEFIGSGTILLIDDEESVRNLAKKFIAEAGFSFIEANNGEDALDVYRKENMNILLVVLDLTMPKMSGEETLLELNKINPKVKILLSSGYSEKEVASRFAGKGASGFLQKPYTYLEFVEKVCEVLLPEV